MNNYLEGERLHPETSLSFVRFTSSVKGRRMAEFICDCGEFTTKRIDTVKHGQAKTCGCLNAKDPLEDTRQVWRAMHLRHKHNSDYKDRYISPEWDSFDVFYEDMGDKPEGLGLDRVDNELGYFASNCRWATRLEQSRNQKTSKWWWVAGVSYESSSQAAKALGVTSTTIQRWCGEGEWSKPDCYSELKYS